MNKMKINNDFVCKFLFEGVFCGHISSPAPFFSELAPLYVRSPTSRVVSLGSCAEKGGLREATGVTASACPIV